MDDFKMEEFANEESVIEDDIYSNFKDSVICPICHDIIINPVMCMNCQNSYCQKCIDNWSKRDNRCPNHCENPNYKKSIEKNTILSKLKFKCNKCDGQIFYNDVRKHSENCNSDNKTKRNNEPRKLKKLNKGEIDDIKASGKTLKYITSKKKYINLFL